MRFREEKVALSGDIEAMFNQVAVPEADQVALRFLWRQSPESAIEVYHSSCVTYSERNVLQLVPTMPC